MFALLANEAAATAQHGWILDIVFFVLLLLGAGIGTRIGFVKGVCKIAGWILSITIPFLFCATFAETLERWFGLQTALINAVNNATLGAWLTVGISYLALFLIIKLLTLLIGKVGTALINSIKPLALVNSLLGGVLGLVEAFLLVLLLLLICNWIPSAGLHNFINSSIIVGALFRSGLMAKLPGMIISQLPTALI